MTTNICLIALGIIAAVAVVLRDRWVAQAYWVALRTAGIASRPFRKEPVVEVEPPRIAARTPRTPGRHSQAPMAPSAQDLASMRNTYGQHLWALQNQGAGSRMEMAARRVRDASRSYDQWALARRTQRGGGGAFGEDSLDKGLGK